MHTRVFASKGAGVKLWWIGALAVLGAAGVQAQSNWFTVAGNPADPNVDTVQVDPVAVYREDAARVMSLRVSRATPRRNWEGVGYRSYHSEVVFDCRTRRAHYRQASFYAEPLWRGDLLIHTDYRSDPKPMLFKDMVPNPTQRIVRAACGRS
jgi:hypothetical protein